MKGGVYRILTENGYSDAYRGTIYRMGVAEGTVK